MTMLEFAGWSVLPAAAMFNLSVLAIALRARRLGTVIIAALALWWGLQFALAANGVFASELALEVPLVGAVALAPLLAVAAAVVMSARVRQVLLDLPTEQLIAVNILRVFGIFFVLLAQAGAMAGPFPYSAGWGDVLVGVLAIPLAIAVARRRAGDGAVAAWTVLGLGDLLLAVALGVLSFNGGAGQLIFAGPGSNQIAVLPWSLIPTVLVPFYMVSHGIVLGQLVTRRRSRLAMA